VREVRNVLRRIRHIHARKLDSQLGRREPFQKFGVGLLNQILGLFATLRQPARQIIKLVEVQNCQIFERIRSSTVP